MNIACVEEIHSIGDNATRYKGLAILRALYPSAKITLFGRKNFAKIFFYSNIFDEFIDIDEFLQAKQTAGGGDLISY